MSIATDSATALDDCLLANLGGDDNRLKAKALWYILLNCCQGKAKSIVRTAEKFNGVIAWKMLFQEYRP